MKNDRFLTAIIIGIGALVFLALILFFTRQRQVDYLSDETPENVVHNYILALTRRDYDRAYSFLAEKPNKPALSEFRQDFTNNQSGVSQASVAIGETFIDDAFANVQLRLSQSYGGPFTELSRYTDTALLERENSQWKIVSMPFPFWSWNWFTEEPKPVP